MESPKRSWAKDSLDLFLTSDQEGKQKLNSLEIYETKIKKNFE